jgi:hypothetical protein
MKNPPLNDVWKRAVESMDKLGIPLPVSQRLCRIQLLSRRSIRTRDEVYTPCNSWRYAAQYWRHDFS